MMRVSIVDIIMMMMMFNRAHVRINKNNALRGLSADRGMVYTYRMRNASVADRGSVPRVTDPLVFAGLSSTATWTSVEAFRTIRTRRGGRPRSPLPDNLASVDDLNVRT